MTFIQIAKSGDYFIAEFDGCIGKGKKEFEAIENAHEAARLKRIEERIQKAFKREAPMPLEDIEKELPF